MIRLDFRIIETPKEEPLYVAVSMGEDSVALSHFLSEGHRTLTLVHINHQTLYSDIAENSFRKYVAYLNFLRPKKAIESVVATIIPGKDNSEASLRDARYNAIQSCVSEGSEMVVCHHLDDCTESYLMNCFNGTPEYEPIPQVTKRGSYSVIRPFLQNTKKDIKNYIDSIPALKQFIVEDPSNEDTKIRRNWIRHIVLPLIKEQYCGINTVVKKKFYQY